MKDVNFPCPHCGEHIELTEALAAPLIQAERAKIDELVQKRLGEERKQIADQAAERAKEDFDRQMRDKESELQKRDEQVKQAQQLEREARNAKVQAEAALRDQDLIVERAVAAAKEEAAAATSKLMREGADRDLAAVRRELQEAKARAEQAQGLEREARKAKADAELILQEQDLRIERAVEQARAEASKVASDQARKLADRDISQLREQLTQAQERSDKAEQAEMEARKAKQEAEDAKRRTELEVARRLDEERGKVRDTAIEERDREHRLALADKDKLLGDLRKQIEDLRRTGNVGSQQLAGDVLELDLAQVLAAAFPGDQFERVTKGQSGGDVIQRVMTPSGAVAGAILWESKRTKTWQELWLSKLRDDQRNAKADIAIIASETLPAGLSAFGPRDGVWVTGLATVVPVAAALRLCLVEASRARLVLAAADTTKDSAYTYLTGKDFLARVNRIVEAYVEMSEDLDKEKRSMVKQWNARSKQLDRVLSGIGGLYGDLRGIFGPSLPEVEQLALPGERDGKPKPVVGVDIGKHSALEEV